MPSPRSSLIGFWSISAFLLAMGLVLAVGVLSPAPAEAVETMERGGPPPPTPGWQYGPVNISMRYESSPGPYYRVTMTIKSPANIWFRYWYKNGSGPRWYHVGSGHQTKAFPGCIAIEAFGVNLSEFGPATKKFVPWRADQTNGRTSPTNEDASNSQAE